MVWAGIDIGGTHIKAGLVDDQGFLLGSLTRKTLVHTGYSGVLRQIADMHSELLQRHEIEMEGVKGVGVGAPGTISPEGMVYLANNLSWEEVNLGKDLKESLELPVFVENDASVAALGELCCGSLQRVRNGILLTLGTGLGSGFVSNGEIFSGSHGLGRQAGHMKVGRNFYHCTCGGNGCLETFASGTALVTYYKHRRELIIKAGGDIPPAYRSAKKIFMAAADNEPVADEAFRRFVHYLGIGVANLIDILDPEVIAIGGGLSKAGDQLLLPLQHKIAEQVYDAKRMSVQLTIASLGNEAGMIGSAMYARRKINENSG